MMRENLPPQTWSYWLCFGFRASHFGFDPTHVSSLHTTRVARLWYILRYHRPAQLLWRLANRLQRRLLGKTAGYWGTNVDLGPVGIRENPAFVALADATLDARTADGPTEHAAGLVEGRFTFLGQTHQLTDPIDWRLRDWPDAPHLWRFHLHYQEYLLDLAAEGQRLGEPCWTERAWELLRQWIDGNPPGDPRTLDDAWHPFCISRRLPVWMILWTIGPPPEDLADRVRKSMALQARFLRRHTERDLGGNHLLENAKALAIAGAFLSGPEADRCLHEGTSLLIREIDKQLLPHGEHFERSPMYHALMAEAVLDAAEAIAPVRPEAADRCRRAADAMGRFLRDILHPDGDIPLLGDSCFGQAAVEPLLRRLGLPRYKAAEPAARQVGDYWMYRTNDDFLLFDAGPVGPDHLPAHAHADLLTLEASVAGRRLLVDSGVFSYADEPTRAYCRSTAAHNVFLVDGQDQCDLWSRFRMGYRGRPAKLQTGKSEGFQWAQATHNAYRRLGAPLVGRWVACREGGPWFCVDWAEGRGRHTLASLLHVHPAFTSRLVDERSVSLEGEGLELSLRFLVPGRVEIETGTYCPEFGRREACDVIRWSTTVELPGTCVWALCWPGSTYSNEELLELWLKLCLKEIAL